MALTSQRALRELRRRETSLISGGVYEQIKNKLVCAYQSLGDRQVKNITDPVSVYRVLPDPAALSQARRQRWPVGLLAVLVIGVIAILGGWYLLLLQKQIANQAPTIAGTQQTPGTPGATANTSQPLPAPAPGGTPKESLSTPAPAKAPVEAPKESSSPSPAAAPIALQLIPEMVSIPGGTFAMGSEDDPSEKLMHRVTIKPLAISKFPITVREWNACVAAKSCTYVPAGKDHAPVANLSWADAQQFVEWLSKVTQKPFRLPSEAEWEYAARGGTRTKFWWGDQLQADMANCKGCNQPYDASQPLKVGSFKPNPFGLYDMGGNIHQWVADCWHKNYQSAPSDGSPWLITTACRMSCARDPGRTIRVIFDPPAVISTTRACAIRHMAYVLHIPYDSGPPSASLGLTPSKRETHLIAALLESSDRNVPLSGPQ